MKKTFLLVLISVIILSALLGCDQGDADISDEERPTPSAEISSTDYAGEVTETPAFNEPEETPEPTYNAAKATATPSVTPEPTEEPFVPVVRLMVTSDIHISSVNCYSYYKLKKVLKICETLTDNETYKGFDGYVICGDISDNALDTQWNAAKSLIEDYVNTSRTQVMLTMGNHDFYDGTYTASTVEARLAKYKKFSEIFDSFAKSLNSNVKIIEKKDAQNVHYTIKGYHMIVLSVDEKGWNYSKDAVQWLKKQIEIAEKDTGTDMPIFLFRHIGSSYSILGTDNNNADGGVKALDEVLENHPQVIDFAGHSHMPINNDCAILQRGHTYINTGTLHFTTSLIQNKVKLAYSDESKYNIAQFYIVEIDAKGTVKIRIYDALKDKYLDRSYTIDSYKEEDFVYTENYFSKKPIYFDESANITIDTLSESGVTFSFSTASEKGRVATYFKCFLLDEENNIVDTKIIPWCYYLENSNVMLSSSFDNIETGIKDRIQVFGCNTGYLRQINDTDPYSLNYLETDFILDNK